MANELGHKLIETWARQVEAGFVLGDPHAPIETRIITDPASGVAFRSRWLPHRALRTNTAELERRGVLDPNRDEASLFRDQRDPSGRHCFLCPSNVRVSHPGEELVPVHAGGRSWQAGANFAWLAQNHFTVMADDHIDQAFDQSVIEAMVDIGLQTAGSFRVVYNGSQAGATIPWHLHLHLTTDPFPIEQLTPDRVDEYPLPLRIFCGEGHWKEVAEYVGRWEARDPQHHRVNLLVATRSGVPTSFVLLRDTRGTVASNKGLMGGWEAAGDFAFDDHDRFEAADLAGLRRAFAEIRPPAA